MATPITSNALNVTASGAAANINSVNGASGESRFSDLLRGQILSGSRARASGMEFSTQMNAANASSAHTAQARRESERAASPADKPQPRPPTREPERARQSAHASHSSHPPARETGQSTEKKTQTASDAQRAERPDTTEEHAQNALNPRHSTDSTDAADNASRTQNSAADASIDHGMATTPAATIAALLGGIAVAEANTDVDAETAADHAASDTLRTERAHPLLAQTGDDAADTAGEEEADTGGASRETSTGTPRHQGATPADESATHARAAAAIKDGGDAATPIHIAAGASVNAAAAAGARAEMLAAHAQGAAPNAANTANTTNPNNAAGTTNAMPLLNMPRLAGQPGAPALQFSIPAGMGQNAWAEEVGNRVMWMLGRAESRAELILTPPNLGKVEVSINLNGDHGTAQFLASSQAARDALEQAMPRLRELLAQAGISLGEASVNTSSESQPRSEEEPDARHRHPAGDAGSNEADHDNATPVTRANWTRLDNGLVNTFA